jgi:ferredoxin
LRARLWIWHEKKQQEPAFFDIYVDVKMAGGPLVKANGLFFKRTVASAASPAKQPARTKTERNPVSIGPGEAGNGKQLPVHLCNHCDSPECFRVCPEKAYSKRKDGIVMIDSGLCNGCMDCVGPVLMMLPSLTRFAIRPANALFAWNGC